MDSITVIVTALASGAAAAAKGAVGEAIKDTYHGLKALLQRKFADKPAAEMVLAKHTEQPTVWEAPLKEVLKDTAADRDEAILTAAQKLLTLVSPQEAATGKYTMHIAGNAQGVVQGDEAHVTMTFGNTPEER